MDEGLRTAALIPAYNAASQLADIIERTRRWVPDVVVVDDGSDDATAAVAEADGAVVLHHSVNRGKGAAIRTGLAYLAEQQVERAIALDADGQHLPEEIPKLLAESDAYPDAMVLAVREKEGQPIAWMNRLANWVADWATSAVSGHSFPDTQCGFRVYPVGAILALGAHGERMEFDIEILIAAARAGMVVRNVRTRVHYPPVEDRLSHYRPFEDTLRIAWVMLSALLWPRQPRPSSP